MKKLLTLLVSSCLFINCTDDSFETLNTSNPAPNPSQFATAPEAKKAHDNSYKGIYKGIITGNLSGSLYVNIYNENAIYAKVTTDNNSSFILNQVAFSEDENNTFSPGTLRFRFAHKSMKFDLMLNETGEIIAANNARFFSAHPSKISLIKEKSNSLVKCFLGSYASNNESGTINFTTDGALKVKGLSKNSNGSTFTSVFGKLDLYSPIDITEAGETLAPIKKYRLNANLHIGQINGLLEGHQFIGEWIDEETALGNWNATRIL